MTAALFVEPISWIWMHCDDLVRQSRSTIQQNADVFFYFWIFSSKLKQNVLFNVSIVLPVVWLQISFWIRFFFCFEIILHVHLFALIFWKRTLRFVSFSNYFSYCSIFQFKKASFLILYKSSILKCRQSRNYLLFKCWQQKGVHSVPVFYTFNRSYSLRVD